MVRPLIGIDLDGVIAVENRVKYFIAKAEGQSSLLNYYQNLKVDCALINQLYDNRHRYRYKIFTARKDDLPNMKVITHIWLAENNLVDLLGWPVYTKFRWKGPELYRHGITAHIDNDYDNLCRLPFIHRIAYKAYSKSGKDGLFKPHIETKNPKNIFAYLNKVCYNINS